ncbi:hypothetical protein TNCV_570581 [Trichonephila clavipes]|nr:hypothetical protein TNCV_570581 [Trichonephila clavipes]
MREDACVRTCQPDYIWSEKLKDLSIADVVGKTWSVILLKLVTLTNSHAINHHQTGDKSTDGLYIPKNNSQSRGHQSGGQRENFAGPQKYVEYT